MPGPEIVEAQRPPLSERVEAPPTYLPRHPLVAEWRPIGDGDVNAVLAQPDILKRLLDLGAINEGPGSPEQLAQFLKDERVRWAKLVKDINLQPE